MTRQAPRRDARSLTAHRSTRPESAPKTRTGPAPGIVLGISGGTAFCCECSWSVAEPARDVEHQADEHTLATGHAIVSRPPAGGAR